MVAELLSKETPQKDHLYRCQSHSQLRFELWMVGIHYKRL